jgi:hypothetical protein
MLRSALNPNERSVSPLREELRLDQSFEQPVAYLSIQAPEPLRLGGCQTKAGHLCEFALYSLQHVLDAHEPSPVFEMVLQHKQEQPTCRADRGGMAEGVCSYKFLFENNLQGKLDN